MRGSTIARFVGVSERVRLRSWLQISKKGGREDEDVGDRTTWATE